MMEWHSELQYVSYKIQNSTFESLLTRRLGYRVQSWLDIWPMAVWSPARVGILTRCLTQFVQYTTMGWMDTNFMLGTGRYNYGYTDWCAISASSLSSHWKQCSMLPVEVLSKTTFEPKNAFCEKNKSFHRPMKTFVFNAKNIFRLKSDFCKKPTDNTRDCHPIMRWALISTKNETH